jgi:predicted phosphodiesterase
MEHLKRENENDLQYILRIVKGKIDNTIDLDYNEIFKLIFNKEYASDNARKCFYGLRDILPYIEEEQMKSVSDNMVKEIQVKKDELYKERVKLQELRVEYNKQIKEEAKWETLKQIIENAINNNKLNKLDTNNTNYINSNKDMLVCLSDIHYGMDIENYWNKYSPDICKTRIETYLSKILQIQENNKCENCYIFLGGDLINGQIHFSVAFENRETTIKQIQGVCELLSLLISELSKKFNKIIILGNPGNHSRLNPDKRQSIKDDKLDILIPWYLNSRLSQIKNVNFIDNYVDNTIGVFDIRDKTYYSTHGDNDDNNKSMVSNMTLMLKKKPYAILKGHNHINEILNIQGVKIIQCGSFCGMNNYCIENRLYGEPEQLVCICSEIGIENYYDIKL